MSPRLNLFSVTSRVFLRLYVRGGHWSCSSMVPTLDVWRYRFSTHQAALLWIFFSVCIFSCVCGSQTSHAYSSWGRTMVLYARAFVAFEQILRFLRMKPRVLLALEAMLFMWLFQHKSVEICTPRYLASSTTFSGWSLRWYLCWKRFPKCRTSHLSGWKDINHFSSQPNNLSNPFCRSC